VIQVRPAHAADLPALAALMDAPLWKRYGLTFEKAEAALAGGLGRGEFLLVAEDAGAPCGLAWVQPTGMLMRSPYLKWLAVDAAHAGQGVGAVLLRAAEHAASAVRPELFILCAAFNAGALRFYAREGYAELGRIPGYVLPDVDEVIFFRRWSA
jgi:GNAT superfamily N-acetyltransferase